MRGGSGGTNIVSVANLDRMPGWPEIFVRISKSANENAKDTQIVGIQNKKWVIYLVDLVQLGIGIEHRRLALLGKYLHVQRDGERIPKKEKRNTVMRNAKSSYASESKIRK